jgi:hypothetical protein
MRSLHAATHGGHHAGDESEVTALLNECSSGDGGVGRVFDDDMYRVVDMLRFEKQQESKFKK